eukprot:14975725-Alexandrium_andersonii.AAC.1
MLPPALRARRAPAGLPPSERPARHLRGGTVATLAGRSGTVGRRVPPGRRGTADVRPRGTNTTHPASARAVGCRSCVPRRCLVGSA